MSTFSDFPLRPEILAALEKNAYTSPTKIQEEVIRASFENKHIVGQSQTGTGKTAAFVIPLLQKIDPNKRAVQAVILAPTRELAYQIREEVFKLSEGLRMKSIAVYGGSPIRRQREELQKGPQIVIATPGRLIDLIDRGYIFLDQVNYMVLDEVDRMLDMGFVDDIDRIWQSLGDLQGVYTFSATITPEIQNLLSKYLDSGYEHIKATEGITVAKIDHSFVEVPHFEKYDYLKSFLTEHKEDKTIIFTRMKREAEEIARYLDRDGYSVGFLHGDMMQRDRMRALQSFKDGHVRIFVTTDVAARGLNMNAIDLVVNYHVPEDPEAYIHRIGRTGRANASGQAVMFVAREEERSLVMIEKRNKITIRQVDRTGTEVTRTLALPQSRGAGNGFGRGRGRYGNSRQFNPRHYNAHRDEGSGFGGGSGGDRGGYQGRPQSGNGGYQGRSDRPQSSGGYQGGGQFAPRNDDNGGYAERPRFNNGPRPQGGRSQFSDRDSRGGESGGSAGRRPPRRNYDA